MGTVMVYQKHSCGNGCGCGRSGRKDDRAASLAKQVAHQVVQDVEAQLRKAPVVHPRTPSLVQQVEAELKRPGNERIIALVDEDSGHVRTLIAPTPYFEQSARNLTLPPEQREALERERKRLIQALPNMVWKDRVRTQQRIRQIERDLDVSRFNDESGRRHRERAAERDRERYGA